jgi:hypothetical protein
MNLVLNKWSLKIPSSAQSNYIYTPRDLFKLQLTHLCCTVTPFPLDNSMTVLANGQKRNELINHIASWNGSPNTCCIMFAWVQSYSREMVKWNHWTAKNSAPIGGVYTWEQDKVFQITFVNDNNKLKFFQCKKGFLNDENCVCKPLYINRIRVLAHGKKLKNKVPPFFSL